MPFNDYLRNSLLNHAFGGTTFTPPLTLYLGLSTTAIAEDGTGITEPVGGAYAREAITNDKTVGWDIALNADNTIENLTEIEFAEATGAWGTITHFFLSDSATGGNILASAPLTTAKAIGIGDIARFTIGSIAISIDETI